MKVLLDHNIPVQVAALLAEHQASSARSMQWDTLKNGDLLAMAESSGFEVLLTADQSIFYQQNNHLRTIALVVVSTNYRLALERDIERIRLAIARASSGSFEAVPIARTGCPPTPAIE